MTGYTTPLDLRKRVPSGTACEANQIGARATEKLAKTGSPLTMETFESAHRSPRYDRSGKLSSERDNESDEERDDEADQEIR